jgi:tRNA U38,U39,U40 pseudouridine synthase TruA
MLIKKKMIRKMIGAAVDCAKNKINLNTLKQMLLCPSDFYELDSITILKANGLFLKHVDY